MNKDASNRTPWQRVLAKFEMSQSEFARIIGRHRSKISRAIKDNEGLISGRDQVVLKRIAKDRGVNITDSDLTPN